MKIPKAKISAMKVLTGLTSKQKNIVKNHLTLNNPAYASAMRFSRNPNYVKESEFIRYYRRVGKDALEVPLRYSPPFDVKVIKDTRVEVVVRYPKWKIELRKDQQTALKAFLKNHEKGVLTLPTGGGKTILGLACASSVKQKVLIITGREDLVKNWREDSCLLFGLKPEDIGLIKGSTFRVGKQITIATVQTLIRRDLQKLRKQFGMLIVDECHHIGARTYTEVLNNFDAKYRIGLTATLERKDGLTNVVHFFLGETGFKKLESDDILPVEIRLIDTEFKKKKERDKRGFPVEPTPEQLLRQVIRNKNRNELLMQFIEGSANQGNNCVVFTHRKEHANILYQQLKKRRLSVALLTGDVKNRDEIFKKCEDGKIRVAVATYHLVKEGINIKSWNRGFGTTSSSDKTEAIQSIGRIRRTKPGKKDCIWYDFRDPLVPKFERHAKQREKYWKQLSKKIVHLQV